MNLSNVAAPAAPNDAARLLGLEAREGEEIGRDPRTMTPDALAALGHTAGPVLRAVRAKCLDCCAGSADEVRKCAITACALWPLRMGTNPFRAKRDLTEQQKADLRHRLRAAR